MGPTRPGPTGPTCVGRNLPRAGNESVTVICLSPRIILHCVYTRLHGPRPRPATRTHARPRTHASGRDEGWVDVTAATLPHHPPSPSRPSPPSESDSSPFGSFGSFVLPPPAQAGTARAALVTHLRHVLEVLVTLLVHAGFLQITADADVLPQEHLPVVGQPVQHLKAKCNAHAVSTPHEREGSI